MVHKFESHKNICEGRDFCGIVIRSKKDNILEFNQHVNSNKMPYMIYADGDPLIEKIDVFKNNHGKF